MACSQKGTVLRDSLYKHSVSFIMIKNVVFIYKD